MRATAFLNRLFGRRRRPKSKPKSKIYSWREFPSSSDRLPQPQGKFINPFTAMRQANEQERKQRECCVFRGDPDNFLKCERDIE